MEPEVLDTKVVGQVGAVVHRLRWLRGVHPTRGVIIYGLTGWETLEDAYVVKPSVVFSVAEPVDTHVAL